MGQLCSMKAKELVEAMGNEWENVVACKSVITMAAAFKMREPDAEKRMSENLKAIGLIKSEILRRLQE